MAYQFLPREFGPNVFAAAPAMTAVADIMQTGASVINTRAHDHGGGLHITASLDRDHDMPISFADIVGQGPPPTCGSPSMTRSSGIVPMLACCADERAINEDTTEFRVFSGLHDRGFELLSVSESGI